MSLLMAEVQDFVVNQPPRRELCYLSITDDESKTFGVRSELSLLRSPLPGSSDAVRKTKKRNSTLSPARPDSGISLGGFRILGLRL